MAKPRAAMLNREWSMADATSVIEDRMDGRLRE
jgi:hypothetical protein